MTEEEQKRFAIKKKIEYTEDLDDLKKRKIWATIGVGCSAFAAFTFGCRAWSPEETNEVAAMIHTFAALFNTGVFVAGIKNLIKILCEKTFYNSRIDEINDFLKECTNIEVNRGVGR